MLIAIPIIVMALLVVARAKKTLKWFSWRKELNAFNEHLANLTQEEIIALEKRKAQLEYELSGE